MKNLEPHRLVEVTWAGEDNKTYTATIKIVSKNEKGALALIAKSLSDEDINIISGNFNTKVDNTTEIFFQIEIDSSEHLYSTLEKLSKLPPVIEAIRTTGETTKMN